MTFSYRSRYRPRGEKSCIGCGTRVSNLESFIERWHERTDQNSEFVSKDANKFSLDEFKLTWPAHGPRCCHDCRFAIGTSCCHNCRFAVGRKLQLKSAPTCDPVTSKLNVNDRRKVFFKLWASLVVAVGTCDETDMEGENCAEPFQRDSHKWFLTHGPGVVRVVQL